MRVFVITTIAVLALVVWLFCVLIKVDRQQDACLNRAVLSAPADANYQGAKRALYEKCLAAHGLRP